MKPHLGAMSCHVFPKALGAIALNGLLCIDKLHFVQHGLDEMDETR